MSEAFVYLWYDALNKMYYLGKHLGVPTDNYAHSSVRMESFTMISKPAHMHRKILAYGTHDEMVELEHDLLVSRKHMFGTRYYNGSASFPTAFPGKDHHNYKHGKFMIILSEEEKKKNQSECFKAWYEQNKEKVNRKTKEWQANNPEKVTAYYKKYNADPEIKKKRAAQRKVREQNPEVKSNLNALRKERYKNDPEYRQKKRDAVRKWQKKNPNYQKEHQAKKKAETQGEGNLDPFLK